ncbi:MAG: ferrous iron transport protein B [Planctomycetes bacterium]|nr:ferrous iron transport protein B [Planctomycetota bacterium]
MSIPVSFGDSRTAAAGRLARVAIAGNPNTGKTTVFNRLTGSRAKVGNYPGVTVDREVGMLALADGRKVEMIDVPGTYSLSARSREEQIAIQAICGLPPLDAPDAVLLVIDSTQLVRNLYLALQVIETEMPVVLALNMSDALEANGLVLDRAALERELGVPVVTVSGKTGEGFDELRSALARVLDQPNVGRPGARWRTEDPILQSDLNAVAKHVPAAWHHGNESRARALAAWALLSIDERDELADAPSELRAAVLSRRKFAAAAGREIDGEIIRGRYGWIDARAPLFVKERASGELSVTDRIDRVLLHPIIGFTLFLLAMGVVFQSLFTWAEPVMGAIDGIFATLEAGTLSALGHGWVGDLIARGLVRGIGVVFVFLPQILLLFFFLGLMEDTGYMARVAFMMDRLMKSIGLHGRAFVPMISGFACAVPAILATRTMERQRDRLLTMLVVPLMTCSARLPVYTLVIAALFSTDTKVFGFLPVPGLMMVAMYVFSTVIALVAGAVLGRTLLRAQNVPLILEMPPYRVPHWPSVLRMMWTKSQSFVTEAGKVIVVCSIAMWFFLRFPWSADDALPFERERTQLVATVDDEGEREIALAAVGRREEAARLEQSLAATVGRAIEPALAPLGFDWKLGIGVMGAFVAREVFIGTMGAVYGIGSDADAESTALRDRMRAEKRPDGSPAYTPLVGLSVMVFFALACQCMSTLAAVKRETHTWRWPLFLFAYMTVVAYVASFVVYQGGRLLGAT